MDAPPTVRYPIKLRLKIQILPSWLSNQISLQSAFIFMKNSAFDP
jgi:hypothetical protein